MYDIEPDDDYTPTEYGQGFNDGSSFILMIALVLACIYMKKDSGNDKKNL